MKFKLVESILNEGKNIEKTFEKYKSKISDRTFFDYLLKLDPTYKEGAGTTGDYGEWILNQFVKGNLDEEQQEAKLATALREFEANKKYIQNKDINSYKTVDDLFNAVENAKPSDRQIARQQKNAKSNKDIKWLYEDDDWVIYTPLTYAGSVYLGKGTNWCTAAQSLEGLMRYAGYTHDYEAHDEADQELRAEGHSEEEIEDMWWDYEETDGDLYVIINKHNPREKYQFHYPSSSYMDKDDDEIDYDLFMNKNRGVCNYLVNKCGFYVPKYIPDSLFKVISISVKDLDIKDITLLSTEEAEQFPIQFRKFKGWWWLRSPGNYSNYAANGYDDGSVHYYGDDVNDDGVCVRPSLIVSNLNSLNLPIYSKVELDNGTIWRIISDNMLLCDDRSFGTHRFDRESNDYEKSEIKQYIHEKAKELGLL